MITEDMLNQDENTAPPVAIIIDFEATSLKPDAQATQIGFEYVDFIDGVIHNMTTDLSIDNMCSPYYFCKPDEAISFGSMAVTGICEEDVANAPNHKILVPDLMPQGDVYVIGHNVDFDINIAKNAGVDVSNYKGIDTHAIARSLYKESDSYSLIALLYQINYDVARKYAQQAHNAGFDVAFCYLLLKDICTKLEVPNMEALYQISETCRTPTAMPFGKHKGVPLAELSKDYIEWLLVKAVDVDRYLLKAVRDTHGITDEDITEMREAVAAKSAIDEAIKADQDNETPTIMPFGKHKGTPLPELDADYVDWLLANATNLKEPLRKVLLEVQEWRAEAE